jgi:hypothetical protein
MGRNKMPRSHWVSDSITKSEEGDAVLLKNHLPKNRIGVRLGIGENGIPYLHVIFPAPDILERFQTVDCSLWLEFPEIGKPFAEAFFVWGRGKRVTSRVEMKSGISRFFTYLQGEYHSKMEQQALGLANLNIGILNGYIGWLNKRRTHNGSPLHPGTKNALLKKVKQIIDILMGMKHYANQINSELPLLPFPWPDAKRRQKPRTVLSNDILLQCEKACFEDMDRAMALIDEGERMVLANAHLIPKIPLSMTDYQDLGICVAAAATELNGIIPPLRKKDQTNKHLLNAIYTYHRYNEVVTRLYPTPRTLVPFILMLASRTFFNPNTLLGLTWSQIREKNWFYGDDRWDVDPLQNKARVEMQGKKYRSSESQVRSFPAHVTDPDNPPVVLRKLKRLTARARVMVEPLLADDIFLFVPTTASGRKVSSYRKSLQNQSGDPTWQWSLQKFIQEYDLPKFSLVNFRFTGSDLVNELSGGDIRTQQIILNHKQAQTTHAHYTSDGARQRNNENIARIQSERVRWVETKGQRDVRNVIGLSTRRAATPGFECLDPFESPQPNQKNGKMCSAYLACPRCPMAVVHRRDSLALASLIKLEAALASAEFEVAPQRWAHELLPMLQAIQCDWLPLFSSETWHDAAKLASTPDIVVE